MFTEFEHFVEAWEQSARSIIGLGDTCSAADWQRESRCPGWTVKDLFSHTVGLERLLLGEPLPQHDPGAKPWVKSDFAKVMEIDVDLRRGRSGADVLEELREVIDARHAALQRADGSEPTLFLGKTVPQIEVFPRRIIDLWMHEQDIRVAVGKPGGMDTISAHYVYDRMSYLLPRALSGKGLPEGGFSLCTDRFERHYLVDGSGGLTQVDTRQPTVLAMSAEAWTAHIGGRADAPDWQITSSGDLSLAEAVVAHLGITP